MADITLQDDPRFVAAIDAFNAGDYFEASEGFEELFFEAVRDEVEFVRLFLQLSVGIHHVERGQLRAAVERLEEGVKAIDRVRDDRGFDLASLREAVVALIPRIAKREPVRWPRVARREGGRDARSPH